MTTRWIIGIDPGSVSGAFAILQYDENGSKILEARDLPVTDRNVNARLLASEIAIWGPSRTEVVVEAVNAMPKQGVSSSFNFGVGFGTILGVVGALGFPVTLVRPSRWKRAMQLSQDGDLSRKRAIDLFPETAPMLARKKDHGRAEAVLLAAWKLGRH